VMAAGEVIYQDGRFMKVDRAPHCGNCPTCSSGR